MRRLVCSVLSIGFILVTASAARAEEQDVVQTKHERTALNSIYLELGGNGPLYSLNYERFVSDEISARIGVMFMSVSASATAGTTTTSAIGGPNHKLELGAGAVLMYFSGTGASTFNAVATASGFVIAPTAIVGYRYVPTDGGFNFRAGFTPLFIAAGGQSTFFPWGGIAAGYSF